MYKFKGREYDEQKIVGVLKDLNEELNIHSKQCLQLIENLIIKCNGYLEALEVGNVVINEKVENMILKYADKLKRKIDIEFRKTLEEQQKVVENFNSLKPFIKALENENLNKSNLVCELDKLNNELDKHFKNSNIANVELIGVKLNFEKHLKEKTSIIFDMRENYLNKYLSKIEEKHLSQLN